MHYDAIEGTTNESKSGDLDEENAAIGVVKLQMRTYLE